MRVRLDASREDVTGGKAQAVNPDKLRHLGPVSDVALLAGKAQPEETRQPEA